MSVPFTRRAALLRLSVPSAEPRSSKTVAKFRVARVACLGKMLQIREPKTHYKLRDP